MVIDYYVLKVDDTTYKIWHKSQNRVIATCSTRDDADDIALALNATNADKYILDEGGPSITVG